MKIAINTKSGQGNLLSLEIISRIELHLPFRSQTQVTINVQRTCDHALQAYLIVLKTKGPCQIPGDIKINKSIRVRTNPGKSLLLLRSHIGTLIIQFIQ